MKNHHSKDVKFKFQLKRSCCLDVRSNFVQLPISYCVRLIMVTITGQVFINISQTEHFSTVKFEKNMSFLVIAKSYKVEKTELGSFK